jgi:two-component system, chemotaxis family, chemotaxis protein CheY
MALNILVVDDSAVVRKMIIRTLSLAGLPIGEVHEAGDGREGLQAMEGHWMDVVFTDLNMPVLTGDEMIAAIRANTAWQDLPVVVISTEGSQTRINSLLDKNIRFIHKPFTPETIRSVIKDMLGVCHEQPSA